jgi:hypothetical protein
MMRFTEDDCIEAENEAKRLTQNKELGRLPKEYVAIQSFLKNCNELEISMCGVCNALARTGDSYLQQEAMFQEMTVKSLLILFHGMNRVLYNNKFCFELCPDCHNHSGTRRRCSSCNMWSCNKCHKKFWLTKNTCDRCSRKCRKCWNVHRRDEDCACKIQDVPSGSNKDRRDHKDKDRERRKHKHNRRSDPESKEITIIGRKN